MKLKTNPTPKQSKLGCLSAGRSGSNREHTAIRNSLSFNHLGSSAYQIQCAFLMLQPVCAQHGKPITYLFPCVCPSICSVHFFAHLICFTVSGSFESASDPLAGWMHATPSLNRAYKAPHWTVSFYNSMICQKLMRILSKKNPRSAQSGGGSLAFTAATEKRY